MRTLTGWMVTGGLLAAATLASAQGPGGRGPGPGPGPDDLVTRMLAFDKDKDGTLTRAEVTDERLHRLFDRADADKNGSVTRAELNALAAQEAANERNRPPGFGPPGGGPGGPMMGPPPRPGDVLPPMLRQRLNLSAEQISQLDDLQKDVDARLEKILNDEQRKQLKEMRQRGPGGRGGPGRFGPTSGGGPPGGGPPPPPDRPR